MESGQYCRGYLLEVRQEVAAGGPDGIFFRFRSQGPITYTGSRLGWVVTATKQIDFTESILIEEAYAVCVATHGGFGYQDLRDMPFPLYEKLIDHIVKHEKEQANGR